MYVIPGKRYHRGLVVAHRLVIKSRNVMIMIIHHSLRFALISAHTFTIYIHNLPIISRRALVATLVIQFEGQKQLVISIDRASSTISP